MTFTWKLQGDFIDSKIVIRQKAAHELRGVIKRLILESCNKTNKDATYQFNTVNVPLKIINNVKVMSDGLVDWWSDMLQYKTDKSAVQIIFFWILSINFCVWKLALYVYCLRPLLVMRKHFQTNVINNLRIVFKFRISIFLNVYVLLG